MNPLDKLNELLQMKHETEVVEFKAASVEYLSEKFMWWIIQMVASVLSLQQFRSAMPTSKSRL